MTTYYQILGVKKDDTTVQIDTAYQRLIKLYAANAEKTAELKTAHFHLSNAERRKKYDDTLTTKNDQKQNLDAYHKFTINKLEDEAYPSINLYFVQNSAEFKYTFNTLHDYLEFFLDDLSKPKLDLLAQHISNHKAAHIINKLSDRNLIIDDQNYLTIDGIRSRDYPPDSSAKDDVVVIYLLPLRVFNKLGLPLNRERWLQYHFDLIDLAAISNDEKQKIKNAIESSIEKYFLTTPDPDLLKEIAAIKVFDEEGKEKLQHLYGQLRNALVETDPASWSIEQLKTAENLLENLHEAAIRCPYEESLLPNILIESEPVNRFPREVETQRARIANDIGHCYLAQQQWQKALEHFIYSNAAMLNKLMRSTMRGKTPPHYQSGDTAKMRQMELIANNCQQIEICYKNLNLQTSEEVLLNKDMLFKYNKRLMQARREKVVHVVSAKTNNTADEKTPSQGIADSDVHLEAVSRLNECGEKYNLGVASNFLEHVLMRAFGVKEPIKAAAYRFRTKTPNDVVFYLEISIQAARIFVENFNAQFPGCAELLATNITSKTDKESQADITDIDEKILLQQIGIDKAVFKTPELIDLFKKTLAKAAEEEPAAIAKYQADTKADQANEVPPPIAAVKTSPFWANPSSSDAIVDAKTPVEIPIATRLGTKKS